MGVEFHPEKALFPEIRKTGGNAKKVSVSMTPEIVEVPKIH